MPTVAIPLLIIFTAKYKHLIPCTLHYWVSTRKKWKIYGRFLLFALLGIKHYIYCFLSQLWYFMAKYIQSSSHLSGIVLSSCQHILPCSCVDGVSTGFLPVFVFQTGWYFCGSVLLFFLLTCFCIPGQLLSGLFISKSVQIQGLPACPGCYTKIMPVLHTIPRWFSYLDLGMFSLVF